MANIAVSYDVLDEAEGSARTRIVNYLENKIAHPDPGSEFDEAIGIFKYPFRIPGLRKIITPPAVKLLEYTGRGVILAHQEGRPAGWVAYHVHPPKDDIPKSMHVFRVETELWARGQGLGHDLTAAAARLADERGIRTVRMGSGNSPEMDHLLARYLEREDVVARTYPDTEKRINFFDLLSEAPAPPSWRRAA